MPSQVFDVKVRPSIDFTVLELHGQVNRDAETELDSAYDVAAGEGAGALLLNFSGVDYINSTGIAVIVGLLARARKDGRTLAVCGLTEHYRTIFEITRLVDFMHVYPDEDSALTGAQISRN